MRRSQLASILENRNLRVDDWSDFQHLFWDSEVTGNLAVQWPWTTKAASLIEAADASGDLENAWVRPFSRGSDAPDTFNFASPNTPPLATIDDHSVRPNDWVRVQDWLSYSDSDGNPAVQYQFFDGGDAANSAYIKTYNHDHWSGETEITVAASDLSDVWVRGGQTAGVENMYVRAFDGTSWSEWDNFVFTTKQNSAPDVWINRAFSETSEWSPVGTWVSYSDADGDAATHYQFRDDGLAPNSAFLQGPDNSRPPAGTEITVAAADLSHVWVHSGAAGTADTMRVRAYDGIDWSAWEPIYFATDNANVSFGSTFTLIMPVPLVLTLYHLAQPGSDTFIFSPGQGNATIGNFDPSEDIIQFEGTALADFAAVLANTTDNGGNSVIAYDVGGSVTLEGVTRAALQASNFDFV